MEQAQGVARCVSCNRGLGFEEWSRGLTRCPYCTAVPNRARRAGRRPSSPPPAAARVPGSDDAAAYERMLDDIPEELLDELVGMLEAEVERRPALAARIATKEPSATRAVIEEIGLGSSAREYWWAAWGFAGGFAGNVLLAKYAQMSASASMGEFAGPLLIGGVVAGSTCALIGWGLAKLRE